MKSPEHIRFLKANGHELGALTGTDYRALAAIAALFSLYAYSRHENVLVAVRHVLAEMQASTRHLAKPLIAQAMDWSDQEPVWAAIGDVDAVVRAKGQALTARALERAGFTPLTDDDVKGRRS